MLLDMGLEAPPAPPPPPSETEGDDAFPNPADVRAFVLIIALEEDEFHIVGQNASLDFAKAGPSRWSGTTSRPDRIRMAAGGRPGS